jgi:hypothetical protein
VLYPPSLVLRNWSLRRLIAWSVAAAPLRRRVAQRRRLPATPGPSTWAIGLPTLDHRPHSGEIRAHSTTCPSALLSARYPTSCGCPPRGGRHTPALFTVQGQAFSQKLRRGWDPSERHTVECLVTSVRFYRRRSRLQVRRQSHCGNAARASQPGASALQILPRRKAPLSVSAPAARPTGRHLTLPVSQRLMSRWFRSISSGWMCRIVSKA